MHELQSPKLIKTGLISGAKGNLGFLESGTSLPFEPRRIYWIDRTKETGLRGNHAHINSSRVFSVVNGSVKVRILFKDGREKDFQLLPWSDSLLIPAGFWYECHLSEDALLLVISSHTHQDDIYLYDKQAYLSGYMRKNEWVYSHNYLPLVYKRSYPLNLYAIRRYQYVVNDALTDVFYLAKGKEILGRWAFQFKDKKAISITGAPFGGIQMKEGVPTDAIEDWMRWVLNLLAEMGITLISNRCKPEFLMSSEEKLYVDCLQNLGLKPKFSDASQYINVKSHKLAQLHPMEKRKWERAKKLGFKFVEESAEILPEVYYFIARARYNRGIPLNTTLEKLEKLFKAYPDHYLIFSVFNKRGVRLATCIAVLQSENSLYYYLPATGVDFLSDSPMVFLLGQMLRWAKKQKLSYLDLGVSSIEGNLQQGLFDFKKRMGALQSQKYTLELSLVR